MSVVVFVGLMAVIFIMTGVQTVSASASCGTASKIYAYSATSFGSDTACDANSWNMDTNSYHFPGHGSTVGWSCCANGVQRVNCQYDEVRCNAIHLSQPCGWLDGTTDFLTVGGQFTTADHDGAKCGSSAAGEDIPVGTVVASSITGSAAGGPWTWTCTHPQNDTGYCSASPNPHMCGSADGDTGETPPSFWTDTSKSGGGAACYAGTISNRSGNASSGPWKWDCVFAAHVDHCQMTYKAPDPGACGTANGYLFLAADTFYGSHTQCSSGSPSSYAFPSQGGSTSWTCSSSTGTSGTCTATRATPPVVAGTCGTAAKTYTPSETIFSGTMCGVGNGVTDPSSVTFPAAGSSITWKCGGSNGGATSTPCLATHDGMPSVGPIVPNTPTITGPTTGFTGDVQTFSVVGTDSNSPLQTIRYGIDWDMNGVVVDPDDWTRPNTGPFDPSGTSRVVSRVWNSPGVYSFQALTQNWGGLNSVWSTKKTITIAQKPMNGVLNPNSCRDYLATETTYQLPFCNSGDVSPADPPGPLFPPVGTQMNWRCLGKYGGTDSPVCAKNRLYITVSCGDAAGVAKLIPPTKDLCSDNSIPTTAVHQVGNLWRWTCASVISCSAKKSTIKIIEN